MNICDNQRSPIGRTVQTMFESLDRAGSVAGQTNNIFQITAPFVSWSREPFALDGQQLLEVIVGFSFYKDRSLPHDADVCAAARTLKRLLQELNCIKALVAGSPVEMKAERLVEVWFIRQRKTCRTVSPNRKLTLNKRHDLPMECIGIQHRGIGNADGGSWAWFVGDHPIVSKTQRAEVCQCLIRIAKRNGTQPVAQTIWLNKKDERPIEDAQDAHGG